MKDLIVLVADKDIKALLEGLFPRLEHVNGTSQFDFDIESHPNRDNGCMNESVEYLRPFCRTYRHAIVIFDKDGSGQETNSREIIESTIETALASNGWKAENVAAIAIDPEVENWIWVNSVNMSKELNWNEPKALFAWLQENGWREQDASKPTRPKEALEAVLRKTKKPRSASIYKNIAEKVSFTKCEDPAFLKLIEKMKSWFAPSEDSV
ncbi:MAG: hypothetical protein K9J37_23400 [Saprospiraceae bacterium]|nr:hypothetical protein [Saprospiraceae bacterium]MCF8252872.1 hypothetical protein [Saprospiraceae bacterium]MCF8313021.1 hypothetical protein [Saprospiraceae bacterium]MCF8441468.1 hypothetical protein [Saprospiraceae bacterium]